MLEILQFIDRAAKEHGLEFLVIGGLAVNAHGYSRITADVDILVRRAEAERWVALLGEIGYTPHTRQPAFVQLDPPLAGMWPVDLMLVSDSTFANLQAEAGEADVLGGRFPIPSVEHLCALKLHVLGQNLPHRDEKDFIDLVHLLHFNRIDPASPRFCSLIERYGTPALHRRIQHALSGSTGDQSPSR